MLLFQVSPPVSKKPGTPQPTADNSNAFMVTAPPGNYTGLNIIDFESAGTGVGKEKIAAAKKAYADLADLVLKTLAEKGKDKPRGEEWTRIEVVETWKETSSIVWSNFTYKEMNTLVDSFSELLEKGSGNAHIDCDTSAFFVADVFTKLGLECWICPTYDHAFLKVRANKDVWFETTIKGEAETAIDSYFYSESEVKRKYSVYSEEKFSHEMGVLYMIRGGKKYDKRYYRTAVVDYKKSLGINPDLKKTSAVNFTITDAMRMDCDPRRRLDEDLVNNINDRISSDEFASSPIDEREKEYRYIGELVEKSCGINKAKIYFDMADKEIMNLEKYVSSDEFASSPIDERVRALGSIYKIKKRNGNKAEAKKYYETYLEENEKAATQPRTPDEDEKERDALAMERKRLENVRMSMMKLNAENKKEKKDD